MGNERSKRGREGGPSGTALSDRNQLRKEKEHARAHAAQLRTRSTRSTVPSACRARTADSSTKHNRSSSPRGDQSHDFLFASNSHMSSSPRGAKALIFCIKFSHVVV